MTYPRVQDFMIDESGASPIYMAATMNSATISGYFYRAGYTPTGIQESSAQTSLSLYPNPSQNILNIGGLNPAIKATCAVYSIDGKICLQQPLTGCQMDISSLASGNYILKIESSDHKTMTAAFEKR